MAKNPAPTQPGNDLVERVRWLAANLWFGNKSKMADDLNFSHTAVNRVISEGRLPGTRLLAAIGSHPMVRREWLLHGNGEPLRETDAGAVNADAVLPLAERLLPGPVKMHRDHLSDTYLAVRQCDFAATRYWYMNERDDLAADGLQVGDALLVETDRLRLQQPSRLRGHLCAVMDSDKTEPQLRRLKFDPTSESLVSLTPLSPVASILIPSITGPRRRLLRKKISEESPVGECAVREALPIRPNAGGSVPPSALVGVVVLLLRLFECPWS